MKENLQKFIEKLEKEQIQCLHDKNIACQCNIDNCKVTMKQGKKYIKIDIGS